MISFKSFYACPLLIGIALLTGSPAYAEPVIEWKFDESAEIVGGGTIKMDHVRAPAKGEGHLMEKSLVSAASTGLGKGWQAFLAEGYLEVQHGSSQSAAGKHGLVTDTKPADSSGANYAAYMGFGGAGSGENEDGSPRGGTVYVVISPYDWTTGARFGIFGTGHTGEGAVTLGIQKQGGLALKVGTQKDGVIASLPGDWRTDTWYFIAATWRQDEPALLYVREMGDGPATSPAAQTATSNLPVPALEQPKYDPIAFGANWYNPGANASTNDGSNSRIAWVRLDNQSSSATEIETVFQSLGARN